VVGFFSPQNLLSNDKVISQKSLDLTQYCFMKNTVIYKIIAKDKSNLSEVGFKPTPNCGIPFPPQNLLFNDKVISQKAFDFTPQLHVFF
jgi:hypothetical protein